MTDEEKLIICKLFKDGMGVSAIQAQTKASYVGVHEAIRWGLQQQDLDGDGVRSIAQFRKKYFPNDVETTPDK
jgi:hypothetical protein